MIICTIIFLIIYILTCASLTQSYEKNRPSSLSSSSAASSSCHRHVYCLKLHDDVHIKSPAVLMNIEDSIVNSNHPYGNSLSTSRSHVIGSNPFIIGRPHNKYIIPSALSLSLLLPIISIFIMPSLAIASAQDSLQLIHGYHSRTPEIASWIVLISAIVFIQNRLERFLSSF